MEQLLGKTNKTVSRIGFGGATAGIPNYLGEFDPENQSSRNEIIAAIRYAYENGITYFDTAPGYGDGKSEEIFGKALASFHPDTCFLATKAAPCSARELRVSVENSLNRLQRDYVDLLQIHGTVYRSDQIELILQPGGMLDEMEKLRDAGVIRHLGFTGEAQNPEFYQLLHSNRFDVMQIAYNFIFQHPYDPSWQSGSLYDAEKQNMGIVAMRTMTSGIFQKWINQVNPKNQFDYSPALLHFTLSNPLVDVALVGMRTIEKVRQNIAICNDTDHRIDLDTLHNRKV